MQSGFTVNVSGGSSGDLLVFILGGVAVWLLLGAFVAEYGRRRGYPWLPVFLCAMFASWPLTLLGIVLMGDRTPPWQPTRWN